MLPGELAHHLSMTFDRKIGTVLEFAKSLRPAGLLSSNGRGPTASARMSAPDFVNWTLALLVEHKRGESIAANVQRVRALPLEAVTQMGRSHTERLKYLNARTFGDALDALIVDMQSGRFEDFNADPGWQPATLNVMLDSQHDNANVSLWRHSGPIGNERLPEQHSLFFNKTGPASYPIFRQVNLTDAIFRDAAIALGPAGPDEND